MKLRKVIRILDQRVTKAAIVMDEEGNSRRIALSEVRYIEVLDHQLIYHRSDDTFHTFGSLKNRAGVRKGDSFCCRYDLLC